MGGGRKRRRVGASWGDAGMGGGVDEGAQSN